MRSSSVLGTTSAMAAAAPAMCPAPRQTADSARSRSGSVTMTQVYLVANGLGAGTLTFRGANHSFTMLGSLRYAGSMPYANCGPRIETSAASPI